MAVTISTLSQTVEVKGVEDVVVTTTELDTETGDYVREIRLLGAQDVVMYTLRIAATASDKIHITAPEYDF